MSNITSTSMQSFTAQGNPFGYSAAKIDELGASEYTLVGIAVDSSLSVSNFGSELEKTIQEIIRACQHSERRNNLMVRVVSFQNRNLNEIHGYRPLMECDVDGYDGVLKCGGSTPLYDATVDAIKSITDYGSKLQDQDFDANGILFVLTDGEENTSTQGMNAIKDAFDEINHKECLESLVSVLVGVNTDASSGLSGYLKDFKDNAGFTQYVEVKDADKSSLAKLAQFVSKSISQQSSSLGTGGSSSQLSLTI